MNGVICFFFALAVFVANGKITDIKVYIPDRGGTSLFIGCSAMIRCAVVQDVPSKIDYRWTAHYYSSKKTEDLPDKTRSIQIFADKEEFTKYTCYAKDKDGEVNKKLDVTEDKNDNKNKKPKIISTPFSTGLGMNQTLTCIMNEAPKCPNAKFKWYKDGSEQTALNSQTIEVETTEIETKYSCKLEVGGSWGPESNSKLIKEGKRIYSVNLPYSQQLLVGKPATFKAVVSISDKFKNEKIAYVWKDNDITQDPKSPSMATLLPASKGSFNLTVELGPEKETTTIPFETIENLDSSTPKVQTNWLKVWTAGGYYTLVCEEKFFNNYPSITYKWYFKGEKDKDANEMPSCKDKNCKMSNVSSSDKGEYSCSFSLFGMKSPLSPAVAISIKTEKGLSCSSLRQCEPSGVLYWALKDEMWVTLDCIGGICTCLNETCQDGCAVTAAGCPDLRHNETDDGAGDKTGDGAGHKTGNGTGDITVLNRTCIDEPETPAFIIPHGVCDKKDTSCKHEVVELSNNHTIMCDTHTDGGGWIVLQRRPTTTRAFVEKGWDEYISGFGNITDSFWMGLEPMHRLCPPKKKPCELRIDLMFEGQEAYATYGEFNVAGGFDNYKLSVKGFKGMKKWDIMTAANGLRFVAKDAPGTNEGVKCLDNGGGWWFSNTCRQMSLNRMPNNGSLVLTEMKIRRGN